MDKPVDEMTEEEKKLLKEFEKKMNLLRVAYLPLLYRKKKKSIEKRLKLNCEKFKLMSMKSVVPLT
jgi:hypothetical protein